MIDEKWDHLAEQYLWDLASHQVLEVNMVDVSTVSLMDNDPVVEELWDLVYCLRTFSPILVRVIV
jgi:hypothetical protein